MAKRKKSGGFGSIKQTNLTTERKVVMPIEPDNTPQVTEPQSVTKPSAGTKPTWKQAGVEYKRMSFYVSAELRKRIKMAVATGEAKYQDELVNEALENFFEGKL